MVKVIAGNWKMNHGPRGARAFLEAFPPVPDGARVRVILFPPAISLAAALEARGAGVALGVQNIHFEDEGAFTGETSAPMARDAGATHVLVGHSERRHVFGESDEDVRRKVEAALRHDLVPVICLGETLDQRRGGLVAEVILAQLDAAVEVLARGADFMVAYEPVWAIGTGETATPADASQAHEILRRRLSGHLGADGAESVPLLYGGSVKPDNASALLAAPHVDGVLVGGASLDPTTFARIVEAGSEST
jgi:triosephosphate isomerase